MKMKKNGKFYETKAFRWLLAGALADGKEE